MQVSTEAAVMQHNQLHWLIKHRVVWLAPAAWLFCDGVTRLQTVQSRQHSCMAQVVLPHGVLMGCGGCPKAMMHVSP